MSSCNACDAETIVARTEETGTNVVLDALPSLAGRWRIVRRDPDGRPVVRLMGVQDDEIPRYVGHRSTCARS